ncbi:MAG: nitroreductase/quinone reductase family protein [Trebonia sp.]
MAFEKTPAGTRGKGMPGVHSPISKWVNNLMVRLARGRSSGRFMGMDTLVLTTTGAKSGQRRETLLASFPDGDNAWTICAAFGGNAQNPAWYHNIAAHPDQVEIQVRGRKAKVTPSQLTGEERAAAWQRITTDLPRFKGYATNTDRELPIIRLTAA